jgi:hypothetical protein
MPLDENMEMKSELSDIRIRENINMDICIYIRIQNVVVGGYMRIRF